MSNLNYPTQAQNDIRYQGTLGWATLPSPSGGDDTAAIQTVLNSGATYIVARSSQYSVTALTIPAGVTVYGTVPRTYTGTPANGTVFIKSGSGTTPVITLSGKNTIDAIAIVGNNLSTGIKITGNSNTIRRSVITGNTTGIDCNYSGTSLIEANNINTNSAGGITNPVDSTVRDNYLNVNQHGLILGSGSNDNSISGNKFEFNTQNGVNGYQAQYNLIYGNNVDRNGSAGIRLSSCTQTTITGNMLRRNGAAQSSGTAGEDCHIHIEGCSGVVANGNSTSTGANDDGTGYTSPQYTAYIQDNTGGVRVVGNDLTGFVTSAFLMVGTNADFSHAQNGVTGIEVSSRTRSALGNTTGSGNIANGATITQTFPGFPVGAYALGFSYQLDLIARDTSTGSRASARASFVVSRESGNASVSMITVTNLLDSAFGTSSTTHTVAASVNTDGSIITVTIMNSGSNAVQYGLTLV